MSLAGGSFLADGNGVTELQIGSNISFIESGTSSFGDINVDAYGASMINNMVVDVSTGMWSGSDKKLKKNISTITSGLEKVLSIRPVSFNWNDKFVEENFKPNRNNDSLYKEHYGFIAQEVMGIIPEIVVDNDDLFKSDKENFLMLNKDEITPFLVSAIQEQQKMIEDLQKEVEYLKMKEV